MIEDIKIRLKKNLKEQLMESNEPDDNVQEGCLDRYLQLIKYK